VIRWVVVLLLLVLILVAPVSIVAVLYREPNICYDINFPPTDEIYVSNSGNTLPPHISVESCSNQRQYIALTIVDPSGSLKSEGVEPARYSRDIELTPNSSYSFGSLYIPESLPTDNYSLGIVAEVRLEKGGLGGLILSRYYYEGKLVVGNNNLPIDDQGLNTTTDNEIGVPSTITTGQDFFRAYFITLVLIILLLLAALGLRYYILILRKKSTTGLPESSKQDYPRFFFERLFKGSGMRSIIFYITLIFSFANFLPNFIQFQFIRPLYSEIPDIIYLMLFHLGVFIVIISTILLGVLYRNKFFELLNIFELGSNTLASVKRSFLGRKPFYICLAILEFPLLLLTVLRPIHDFILYAIYYGWDPSTFFALYPSYYYSTHYYPNLNLGTVSMLVFFIPLGAQIYAAYWSGMLSLRSIIRESVPSSRYSEISHKMREMASIWKWPIIIWITSTSLAQVLALNYDFFYYLLWLYIFTACIFAISYVLIHRDLSRFKNLSLDEIEKAHRQSYWQLKISLSDSSELSKEELDKALKSYEVGLADVRKQVNKMPTWLFSHGLVIGLVLFAWFLISIAWVTVYLRYSSVHDPSMFGPI
jgi:hypothetical protein